MDKRAEVLTQVIDQILDSLNNNQHIECGKIINQLEAAGFVIAPEDKATAKAIDKVFTELRILEAQLDLQLQGTSHVH